MRLPSLIVSLSPMFLVSSRREPSWLTRTLFPARLTCRFQFRQSWCSCFSSSTRAPPFLMHLFFVPRVSRLRLMPRARHPSLTKTRPPNSRRIRHQTRQSSKVLLRHRLATQHHRHRVTQLRSRLAILSTPRAAAGSALSIPTGALSWSGGRRAPLASSRALARKEQPAPIVSSPSLTSLRLWAITRRHL